MSNKGNTMIFRIQLNKDGKYIADKAYISMWGYNILYPGLVYYYIQQRRN